MQICTCPTYALALENCMSAHYSWIVSLNLFLTYGPTSCHSSSWCTFLTGRYSALGCRNYSKVSFLTPIGGQNKALSLCSKNCSKGVSSGFSDSFKGETSFFFYGENSIKGIVNYGGLWWKLSEL